MSRRFRATCDLGRCGGYLPGEALSLGHVERQVECVCGFAIGRGWRTERKGQAAPAVPQPPSPASGRLAASRKCSRQAIGSNWMSTPV